MIDDISKKGMAFETISRIIKLENEMAKIMSGRKAFAGAKVKNTATQSIPNGIWTALTFSTEIFDYGEFWAVASPTILTIREPGIYYINGFVSFAQNGTGLRGAAVYVNGTLPLMSLSTIPANSVGTSIRFISTIHPLNAGDYFQIMAYQSSGAPLNTSATDSNPAEGMIQRMS